LDAYAFRNEYCPQAAATARERLEQDEPEEVDAASVGVEAQFIAAAEGGGQVDGGGVNNSGIDHFAIAENVRV